MLRSVFAMVAEFHEKFGISALVPEKPGMLVNHEMEGFRTKFMQEELDEYHAALAQGDLPKAFDALQDLIYVAAGTLHLHGCPPECSEQGFVEVHRANMAKVRAARKEDSTRGTQYDVVKPKGWTPPEHEPILSSFGWMG